MKSFKEFLEEEMSDAEWEAAKAKHDKQQIANAKARNAKIAKAAASGKAPPRRKNPYSTSRPYNGTGFNQANYREEVELDDDQGYIEEEMGAGAVAGAANAVSHGGVDMNPNGKNKRDRRRKWDFNQMFKRASGKYKK